MCDLLEYSNNYSMTSGSLCNNYRDGVNDGANEIYAENYRIDNSKTVASEYFEYETKIIGWTPANDNTLDTEVILPLRYLSNFWRSLNLFFWLFFFNCDIEFDLSWPKDCVISEISKNHEEAANPGANLPIAARPQQKQLMQYFK